MLPRAATPVRTRYRTRERGIGMKRIGYAVALSVTFLTGCVSMRGGDTETSREEVCRQIGAALPTRSVADTPTTRNEITRQYATFALACRDWTHLIPE